MKVNIGSIHDVRGGAVEFQGQHTVEISDERIGLQLTKPVAVKGTITNTGKGFLVQADLSFEYQVCCGRCLEKYNTSQQVSIQEPFLSEIVHEDNNITFKVSSGKEILGKEPGKDDDVFNFHSDVIDLKECIQEQVLLSLPMSFICHPDCKGLCCQCGKNLNQQNCLCVIEAINPQFDNLKRLLSKNSSNDVGKNE